jgi:hypothetical protein
MYAFLGYLGKVNFRMFGIFSYRGCPALLLVLIAGCQGDLGERLQSGQVFAWHGLQGRWVGPVVPEGKSCGPATQGLMTIGENGFGFDPFQSTVVIRGVVSKDGRLTGDLSHQGTDHQNITASFAGSAIEATSDAEVLEGTLVSGRCRWTVTLHRG